MELNNKEKKIKQVLSDVNFEIDTDFLWKEVSQELDKKKKRRFLWFIIPIGLLGILSAFYFKSNYSLNAVDAVSYKQATEQSLDNKNETLISANEQTISNIKENTFEETQIKNNNKEKVESYQQADINTNQLTRNSINQSINKEQFQSITIDPRLSNSIKPNQINYSSSSESSSIISSKGINVGSGKFQIENLANQKLDLKIDFNKLGLIPFTSFQYSRDRELIGNEKLESIKVSNTNSRRFYYGLAIGGIQNISTKNTITGDFSNEYFDKEIELPGINAGIVFGLQTKNDWRFFGGFDYSQLVTRFVNIDVGLSESTSPIENQQTINSVGEYQTTTGNLTTTTLTRNDISWHKRHQEYNFQLGVSKNLLTNSKYRIAPELSVIQNINSSHSGYYFSELPQQLIKFTGREENPYRNNTGLKTQLGLNVGYQFGGLEFSIHGGWRNPLSAITNESNFYQIKNSQLSILARVNYLLNWENK